MKKGATKYWIIVAALFVVLSAFQNCRPQSLSGSQNESSSEDEFSPSIDSGGTGNGDGYNGATNNHDRRSETFESLQNYDLYWLSGSEVCQSPFGPSPAKGILQIDKGNITYFPGCDKSASLGTPVREEDILFGGDERVLGYTQTKSNFEFKDTFPTVSNTNEFIEGACYYYALDLPEYRNDNYPERELEDFRATVYRNKNNGSVRGTNTQFFFEYTPEVIAWLENSENGPEPTFVDEVETFSFNLNVDILSANERVYFNNGDPLFELYIDTRPADDVVFGELDTLVDRGPASEDLFTFDRRVFEYDENTCLFNTSNF